jgi:hypothetical protein
MHRIVLLIAVFAGLAVFTGPASGRITKPTLRIADTTPLAVQGVHFRSAERVTVVVASNGRHAKVVRASQLGRFVVRFASVNPDVCNGFVVTATGNRGSRATYKLPQRECPPGPADVGR